VLHGHRFLWSEEAVRESKLAITERVNRPALGGMLSPFSQKQLVTVGIHFERSLIASELARQLIFGVRERSDLPGTARTAGFLHERFVRRIPSPVIRK
jgi:hypothetical protein